MYIGGISNLFFWKVGEVRKLNEMKGSNILIVVGLYAGALLCAGQHQRWKGNHIVKIKICVFLPEGVQKEEVFVPFLLGFMAFSVYVQTSKL
jgi:hypothetical protein